MHRAGIRVMPDVTPDQQITTLYASVNDNVGAGGIIHVGISSTAPDA